jgi:ribosomal protein L22
MAEAEAKKTEGKEAAKKTDAKPDSKVEAKPASKPETKVEAAPETKSETAPAASEKKPEAKPEPKVEAKPAKPVRKKKSVASHSWDAGVSLKSSKIVADAIRGRKVDSAVRLLEDMMDEKRNIRGRFYTKTAAKFIELLKNAQSNAKVVGMDDARLHVYVARASKGRTFFRPRTKVGRSGEKAKLSNIEIVVGEK